jgi:hypothetical protein
MHPARSEPGPSIEIRENGIADERLLLSGHRPQFTDPSADPFQRKATNAVGATTGRHTNIFEISAETAEAPYDSLCTVNSRCVDGPAVTFCPDGGRDTEEVQVIQLLLQIHPLCTSVLPSHLCRPCRTGLGEDVGGQHSRSKERERRRPSARPTDPEITPICLRLNLARLDRF